MDFNGQRPIIIGSILPEDGEKEQEKHKKDLFLFDGDGTCGGSRTEEMVVEL